MRRRSSTSTSKGFLHVSPSVGAIIPELCEDQCPQGSSTYYNIMESSSFPFRDDIGSIYWPVGAHTQGIAAQTNERQDASRTTETLAPCSPIACGLTELLVPCSRSADCSYTNGQPGRGQHRNEYPAVTVLWFQEGPESSNNFKVQVLSSNFAVIIVTYSIKNYVINFFGRSQ